MIFKTAVGLWTGRIGMLTVVVLTVLAGRRLTGSMPFLPRLLILVVLVLIVLVVVAYATRQAQARRLRTDEHR